MFIITDINISKRSNHFQLHVIGVANSQIPAEFTIRRSQQAHVVFLE